VGWRWSWCLYIVLEEKEVEVYIVLQEMEMEGDTLETVAGRTFILLSDVRCREGSHSPQHRSQSEVVMMLQLASLAMLNTGGSSGGGGRQLGGSCLLSSGTETQSVTHVVPTQLSLSLGILARSGQSFVAVKVIFIKRESCHHYYWYSGVVEGGSAWNDGMEIS